MRILITGACGLLGAHLAAHLASSHEVIGLDRNPWWGKRPLQVRPGDLAQPGWIESQIKELKLAWVIHCAALANVDRCEQEPALAEQMNSEMTRRIARTVQGPTRILYISTDGVFHGDRPFAFESWAPTPRTVYGRTKRQGELAVEQHAPDHLIVRTNFYGWSSGRKKTAGEWLEEALRERKEITLFHDFYFTPLYVVDLVERLKALMESGLRGTFHLAGKDRVSKYEFGSRLAECAGYSMDHVRRGSIDDAGFPAPRPKDMSLSSERFEQLTGIPASGCDEGIRRFITQRGVCLEERFQRSNP